jgi:hypothetical protein
MEAAGESQLPERRGIQIGPTPSNNYGLSLLTATAALVGVGGPLQAQDKKPNILIIWGDDIGQFNNEALKRLGPRVSNFRRVTGGGAINVPWGVSIDGNDDVWVGNFWGRGVVLMAGAEPQGHPAGTKPGDAIHVFQSGSIQMITEVAVDPAGNLWAANNWNALEPVVAENSAHLGRIRPDRVRPQFRNATKQKSYEKHTYKRCLDYRSSSPFLSRFYSPSRLSAHTPPNRAAATRTPKPRNWPKKPQIPSPT